MSPLINSVLDALLYKENQEITFNNYDYYDPSHLDIFIFTVKRKLLREQSTLEMLFQRLNPFPNELRDGTVCLHQRSIDYLFLKNYSLPSYDVKTTSKICSTSHITNLFYALQILLTSGNDRNLIKRTKTSGVPPPSPLFLEFV